MIICAVEGVYIFVPIGLLLYFIYEVARYNRPEVTSVSKPHWIWWGALAVVLVIVAALIFELSSGNLMRGGPPPQTTSAFTISTTTSSVATSVESAATTSISSSSTTTSVGSTSTIVYMTQSATAATTSYGSGSIFLKDKYSLYICGGSSTSTTGVSWKPNVFVRNYSSVGINANGTCTLYNNDISGYFNSNYATIAGIGMNASNYTLFNGANITQMLFHISYNNSFVVAIITGNLHVLGPYFMPSPLISYPASARAACNATTEQQTTPAVKENSTSFVKSTVSLMVCPQADAGDYLLSEKNLTDASYAIYVFSPR